MTAQAAILDKTWELTYHFDGEEEPRRITLPRPSVGTFSEYSKHLESLALAGIRRHKNEMDDVDYRFALDSWGDSFTYGAYDKGQPRFWKSFDSDGNKQKFFWIWLQDYERTLRKKDPQNKLPNITEEQVHKMWEDVELEIWGAEQEPGIMVQMLREANPSRLREPKAGENR